MDERGKLIKVVVDEGRDAFGSKLQVTIQEDGVNKASEPFDRSASPGDIADSLFKKGVRLKLDEGKRTKGELYIDAHEEVPGLKKG